MKIKGYKEFNKKCFKPFFYKRILFVYILMKNKKKDIILFSK